MNRRYLAVATLAVVSLAACGSSNNNSSGANPASTTVATASPSSSSTASPSTAAKTARPLPAPCTLLTRTDVAPLFGTTDLNATPSADATNGTALCSFSLRVGVQGLGVSIKTHTDYANDASYIFPSEGTSVAGIGDLALITTAQAHSADITVKLGGNAIAIHVEFYTKPIDNAFLTQLARDAVARV